MTLIWLAVSSRLSNQFYYFLAGNSYGAWVIKSLFNLLLYLFAITSL